MTTKIKTKCKTESGLRICVGEKSTLGEQSQQELDGLLGHFFSNVRKKDGSV